MKCCHCKYNSQGQTDYDYWNSCSLIGFEYYHEFYEEECPYIGDDYVITECGKEMIEQLEKRG